MVVVESPLVGATSSWTTGRTGGGWNGMSSSELQPDRAAARTPAKASETNARGLMEVDPGTATTRSWTLNGRGPRARGQVRRDPFPRVNGWLGTTPKFRITLRTTVLTCSRSK